MRHESPVWVLENNDIKIIVERETGWLRALIYKDKNIELLGGQIGGLKLYDGLKNEWYSDLQTPFRISSGKCDGKKLEFVKKVQAADFNLSVTLSLVEDYIKWEVGTKQIASPLLKNRGVPRTIRVHFFLPLPIGFQFWSSSGIGETLSKGKKKITSLLKQER